MSLDRATLTGDLYENPNPDLPDDLNEDAVNELAGRQLVQTKLGFFMTHTDYDGVRYLPPSRALDINLDDYEVCGTRTIEVIRSRDGVFLEGSELTHTTALEGKHLLIDVETAASVLELSPEEFDADELLVEVTDYCQAGVAFDDQGLQFLATTYPSPLDDSFDRSSFPSGKHLYVVERAADTKTEQRAAISLSVFEQLCEAGALRRVSKL